MRLAHGWYQFNPTLSVVATKVAPIWLPVLDALNLRVVAECAEPSQWDSVDAMLDLANHPRGRSPPPASDTHGK